MAECTVCSHLVKNEPNPRLPQPPRSESWHEWRRSAAGGCSYCQIIVSGLNMCDQGSWCRDVAPMDNGEDCHIMFQSRPLSLLISNAEHKKRSRRFYFYIGKDSVNDGLDKFIPPFTAIDVMETRCPETGGSTACFTKVPKILRLCAEEHKDCPREEEATDHLLPTRVIDIGDPDVGQPPHLYETKGARGRYICLSHRWGNGVKIPTLLTSNLAARLEKVEVEDLPRNFRDCMDIARRLGVRYVWIDSLCIIQDTEEDWQQEGSKMAEVYGNCYLCITASAAANADTGLGYGAHHAGIGPFLIDPAITKSIAPGLEIFVQEIPFDGHFGGFYSTAGTNMHNQGHELHSRGWCHQEFFLPPRILQYEKGNLQWDCATTSFSCYNFDRRTIWHGVPGGRDKFVPATRAGQNSKAVLHRTLAQAARDPARIRELYDLWLLEVESYTGKNLTFEADRLIAFAGIANRFANLGLQRPYLAGIWFGDAWRQLCWMVHSSNATRPMEYTAPSFSWASGSGQIKFARTPTRESPNIMFALVDRTVDILSGDCEPAYGSEFGAVMSGFLRVRGRTVEGRYHVLPDDRKVSRTINGQRTMVPVKPRDTVSIDGQGCYPFIPDVLEDLHEGMHLVCLSMATTPRGVHAYLMLTPAENDASTFRRVGWAWPTHMYFEWNNATSLSFEGAELRTLKIT